jgi:hypothetical protein
MRGTRALAIEIKGQVRSNVIHDVHGGIAKPGRMALK